MKVALIGINPVAALAIEIAGLQPGAHQLVLADDDIRKHGTTFKELPVSLSVKELINNSTKFEGFTICFGEKLLAVKKNLFRQLTAAGLKPVNFLHPTLTHFPSTLIGSGNVVGATVTFGHQVRFGNNNIVFGGAVIEHDCIIADHVYIGPNVTLSGFCQVGECTLIGSGATILPEIKIGRGCVIGAGAVVTKDIPDNTTVAGVPARPVAGKKA